MGFLQSQPVRKSNGAFINEEMERIKAEFCLENQHLEEFYASFVRFGPRLKGYLDLDDLVAYFSEGHAECIELPYLDRLFEVMGKKCEDKLFFEEFVVGVSTFCLMNSEALARFIFEWIDTDLDDRVSKYDIVKAASYRNPRSQDPCFFTNFAPEVEALRLKDKQLLLDFEEFRQQVVPSIHFLQWPAFQLQEKLRSNIIGAEFWKQLYLKIEKAEYAQKNNEKKIGRIKEKIEQLKSLKLLEPEHRRLFKEHLKERKRREVSTDVNLESETKRPRRLSCLYLKS